MVRSAAVIALGLFFFASVAAAPARVKCCHGCDMYSCNPDQCGKSCKAGPKCHNCWKDCPGHHQ